MTLDTLYRKVKKQSLQILKMKGALSPHPVSNSSRGYTENILAPVALSGVVAPWSKNLSDGATSDYKLVSYSGLEYFIVADGEWREVLSTYCWQEVKVIGLLNVSNMTLIPQKIHPKGPEGENVIDLAAWKSKELVKKLVKNVNDTAVIPAAVLAVLSA